MHIKQITPGVFKTLLGAAWLVLAWLCCTVASAATSASLVVTPSAAVAPADVTLSVVVTATPNPVTLARVEYVNGNSRLGEATTAPFSLNLSSLGPGKYVIKAYAWLADGQNTMLVSAPVALTITGGTAASAAIYYIHTDQLDTPRVITDQNQAVVWKWESDGFGSVPPNEQPGAAARLEFNPRFAGQYFDRESGLHYNYYRDYDPQTGRYMQSDLIGLNGGINTYGYVEGNPVSRVDPDGLVAISPPAVIIGSGIVLYAIVANKSVGIANRSGSGDPTMPPGMPPMSASGGNIPPQDFPGGITWQPKNTPQECRVDLPPPKLSPPQKPDCDTLFQVCKSAVAQSGLGALNKAGAYVSCVAAYAICRKVGGGN